MAAIQLVLSATLALINARYQSEVKPFLADKCFPCHSDQTDYPWYHSLPVAQGMIDRDVAIGREHILLHGDFPFPGIPTPAESLQKLKDVAAYGSMPPYRYKAMHWGSSLSAAERRKLTAWAKYGLDLLAQPEP